MSEMRTELDETMRSKEQQERLIHQMADELRQMKAKLENQGQDFSTVLNDMKNKNRKIEEDARQTVSLHLVWSSFFTFVCTVDRGT